MQWQDIPWQPARKTLRQFAGLWLLFWAVLAVWNVWPSGEPWPWWTVAAAGLLGAAGLVKPSWIRPLFVGWILLVFPIGWLVLNSCLAAIYFAILTPLGLWFRLMGRDALHLRGSQEASYWQDKPQPPVSNYYRTF